MGKKKTKKSWKDTTFPIVNQGDYVLGWIVETPAGGYCAIPKKGAWPLIDPEKFGGYANYFGDLGVDTPKQAHKKCWPEPDELLGANRDTPLKAFFDLVDGHMSDLTNTEHPGPRIGHHHFWDYLTGTPRDVVLERVAQDDRKHAYYEETERLVAELRASRAAGRPGQ